MPDRDVKNSVQLEQESKVIVNFNINEFFMNYAGGGALAVESYNPVLQKAIGSTLQNGISIIGQFMTNYDPVEAPSHGGYSYITVRKSSVEKADVISGYGIAWRPTSYKGTEADLIITGTFSGPSTITVDTGKGNAYFGDATVAFIEYTIHGKNYYLPFDFERATGSDILTGCVFPENIDIANISTDPNGVSLLLAEPNLFIVDNDLLNFDMYSGRYIEFPGNTLAFIESTIIKIIPGQEYWFKLEISDDNGIDFYLADSEAALEVADVAISCGARTVKSEYSGATDRDSFGITVFDTAGYEWYYDNIKMSRLDGKYTVNYFEMDVSRLSDLIQVHVKGYGNASDGDGLELLIWNPNTLAWVKIGDNTFSSSKLMISDDIEKETYVDDNTIKLQLRTSSASNTTTHAKIVLDYFAVKSSYNSGVNIGGCVDVYVDDEYLKEDTIDVTPDATDLINVIPFGRAVVYVDKIIIKGSDPEIILTEGYDYIWMQNNADYLNSIKGQSIIKFSPGVVSECTIYYHYSPLIKNLQIWSDGDHVAFKGQDVLFRHKNIHLITVVATTGDDHTESDIRDMVEDYIETLRSIDSEYILGYEDIVNYLYTQGVRSLERLTITDDYRIDGEITKSVISAAGDRITINKIEVFKMAYNF